MATTEGKQHAKGNQRLNDLLKKVGKPSLLDEVPALEGEVEKQDKTEDVRTGTEDEKGEMKEKVQFTMKRYPRIKQIRHPNRDIFVTAAEEKPFVVIEDDMDRTPRNILEPGHKYYSPILDINEFGHKRLLEKSTSKEALLSKSNSRDFIDKVNRWKRTSLDSDDMSFSMFSKNISPGGSEKSETERVPSLCHAAISDDDLHRTSVEDKERLVLQIQETPTIPLFSIRSSAADVETIEGFRIIDANRVTENESQRIKKQSDAICQAVMASGNVSSVNTSQPRPLMADKGTFAAIWDHLDMLMKVKIRIEKFTQVPTLKAIGKVDKIEFEKPEIVMEPIQAPNLVIDNPSNFYAKAMVIEHLLASNNAKERQELFRSPHDPYFESSPSDRESNTYKFKFMWTFSSQATLDLCVNSLSWNLHDPNILAIGYGSQNSADSKSGLAFVWNVKNLVHAEREYMFTEPVKCVEFSHKYPNILAIAFDMGNIKLVDITSREILVVGQNMPDDCTLQYKLTSVTWIDDNVSEDSLVECLGNGHVNKYLDTHLRRKKCVHHITKIQNIDNSKCLFSRKAPSAVCIQFHPIQKNIYLLASSEGAIYRCDLNNTQNYIDMFVAHNGPIYSIEFNPVSPTIFLTSGADWCVKIWAEKLTRPLVILTSGMTRITNASWHPHIPTIVLNLNEDHVEIWDISKKLIKPQLTITSPKKTHLTALAFSLPGNCICVGDMNGNAHIYLLKIVCNIESPVRHLARALLEALSADSAFKAEAIQVTPLLKSHRK